MFAYAHLPAGVAPSGTGVLICPPWGWDEVTSYRARRAWADRLAAAGHVALRIDFPGSGDSAGTPADPDLVSSWRDAAATAARWLRDRAGCERVAVLGLGMGGLIAALAVDQAALADDLILWGTPTTGRSFMREARAFGSLQGSRSTSAGGESTALPE
ncbi:MAG TPA: alpha/beta fold hydrolase, partial [Candidatus Binatia bacterium]|nr:alpha/beta fold hydrolase [Candidatus Binatia bacterium]